MTSPREFTMKNPIPQKTWDGKEIISFEITLKNGTTYIATMPPEEVALYKFINEKLAKLSDQDVKTLSDLIEDYGHRMYSEGYDSCEHDYAESE